MFNRQLFPYRRLSLGRLHLLRSNEWQTILREAPASSTPEVPADLIQSCLNGECVLFAGAGLSARAGVVTWYRFLQNLLAFAQSHRVLDTSYASSMSAALQEGERDAVADGLAQAFGDRRNLLHDFLRELFPAGTALATAHDI